MATPEATVRTPVKGKSPTSTRVWTRGLVAGGATVVLVALIAAAIYLVSSDRTAQPAAAVDSKAIMQDLVNRGLIPSQALEPASRSTAEITQDLVNRGLIPSQALEPASRSTAEITQDLVNRGLIPSQTLEPASSQEGG